MAILTTQNHEQKSLTSNTTQTFQIPPSGRIQSLLLEFYTSGGAFVTEAQIRAEIGAIRLTINGKDIVNTSATRLLDLYEFLSIKVGTAGSIAGVMELNLGRLAFLNPDLRAALGFGTSTNTAIQIQVTAGTLSAIASCRVVSARDAMEEPVGAYVQILDYGQSFNSTGEHVYDNLPRAPNLDHLLFMIDDGASGTITYSSVKTGSIAVRENLATSSNSLILSNNGYAQPSGYFIHSFLDGGTGGRFPMNGVSDLRIATNFSVAPGAAGYIITAMSLVDFPRNV